MYAVLGINDEKGEALFSVEERQKIQGTTQTNIGYPNLQAFLLQLFSNCQLQRKRYMHQCLAYPWQSIQ